MRGGDERRGEEERGGEGGKGRGGCLTCDMLPGDVHPLVLGRKVGQHVSLNTALAPNTFTFNPRRTYTIHILLFRHPHLEKQ